MYEEKAPRVTVVMRDPDIALDSERATAISVVGAR